jgi:RNA polymerase sigma factor (sigma-70 family)
LSTAKQYEDLVERHARMMSSAIRRVCARRRDLVPDVEQEVRLALWKRLQTGKEITHPVSYLYRVALTTALAVLERHEEIARPLEERVEPGLTTRSLLPAERSRLLEEILGQLPSEQARALRGYLSGLNHREVALLYGWSESVARHRVYRGIETLKAKVGKSHG